jgi:hypothetical protein
MNALEVVLKPWRPPVRPVELEYQNHIAPFFIDLGALDGLPAFMAAVLAVEIAIATACFSGLPDFISIEMFFEMVFFE